MRRHYSIWDNMKRMQEEMDNMFDGFFSFEPFDSSHMLEAPTTNNKSVANYARPQADFWENENEYVAKLDIPGCDKEDIKVGVTNNGLEVSVEKKHEIKHEDKKKGYFRYERSHAGFYRNFALPENADKDKVDATYKNGVLELKIPKKEIGYKDKKLIDVK